MVGDFNFIRYADNRNKEGGNIQDMMDFNVAISTLGLVEIPMKGRNFTWRNMQEAPLLEKFTGVFLQNSRLRTTLTHLLSV